MCVFVCGGGGGGGGGDVPSLSVALLRSDNATRAENRKRTKGPEKMGAIIDLTSASIWAKGAERRQRRVRRRQGTEE